MSAAELKFREAVCTVTRADWGLRATEREYITPYVTSSSVDRLRYKYQKNSSMASRVVGKRLFQKCRARRWHAPRPRRELLLFRGHTLEASSGNLWPARRAAGGRAARLQNDQTRRFHIPVRMLPSTKNALCHLGTARTLVRCLSVVIGGAVSARTRPPDFLFETLSMLPEALERVPPPQRLSFGTWLTHNNIKHSVSPPVASVQIGRTLPWATYKNTQGAYRTLSLALNASDSLTCTGLFLP